MTKKAIENFMMYNASYEAGVLAQCFGSSLAGGRTVSLTLSNPELKFMADGVPFGSLSDTSTLQAKPFWTKLFTSPIAASFAAAGTDTRYLHARYALTDPAPTKISCSFMSFTLDKLEKGKKSSMYPDIDNSRYVYLLEIDKVPQELTCDMVRDTLEDCLAQVNPSMGDKVKKGICAPTGLLFSQPETFILYREMLQMNGYSVGQTKPVTVITNEFQRRFFFRMTETFEEIRSICAAGAAK